MSVGTEKGRAQKDIVRLVRKRTANAVVELVVRVDESAIHIGGRAASYYVKQLATQAALAASQGRSVRNEIDVNGG